jgi:hypothetical protein
LALATVTFLFRTVDGLTPDMRIKWGSTYYQVGTIDPDRTDNRWQTVVAQEIEGVALNNIGISGTITGDEVSGVTLTLTGDASRTTTSAADGTYSFTVLAPGDYVVTPTLTDYTFTPVSKAITLTTTDDTDADFVSASV